jgi:thiol:disulfide interchange protein DsbD
MELVNSCRCPFRRIPIVRVICLITCLFFFPGAGRSSGPVVKARTLLAADAAHPGSSVKAAIVAEVAPGFHINEHKPTLDYLIPTELKLESTKDLSAGNFVYPKGQLKKFAFSDTDLSVYEGEFVVGVLVKVQQTIRPGTYTLKGELRYQACNDYACLPPVSIPLSLAVKVVPSSVPIRRINSDVFNKVQFN